MTPHGEARRQSGEARCDEDGDPLLPVDAARREPQGQRLIRLQRRRLVGQKRSGIGATGVPESVTASLAEDRKKWGAGAGHNPARVRRVVAGIAPDVLGADRAALLNRMTAGERLVSP